MDIRIEELEPRVAPAMPPNANYLHGLNGTTVNNPDPPGEYNYMQHANSGGVMTSLLD